MFGFGFLTSPSTVGGSLVFSKNFTAISPVTTPILSVSAAANKCPKYRLSSGLRWRFGCSETHGSALFLFRTRFLFLAEADAHADLGFDGRLP